jgi:outer membrane translocation and assembly module TamA
LEAQELRTLGPLRARLRGGGQNSVRGFRANTLGDAEDRGALFSGGLRQWEASIELRVPLTISFGTAFFVDVGDVTRETTFRLNHPQTTFGFGLRYKTIVGPLRLDVGLLPHALQVFGNDRRPDNRPSQTDGVFGFADGAVHLTIGEAF